MLFRMHILVRNSMQVYCIVPHTGEATNMNPTLSVKWDWVVPAVNAAWLARDSLEILAAKAVLLLFDSFSSGSRYEGSTVDAHHCEKLAFGLLSKQAGISGEPVLWWPSPDHSC